MERDFREGIKENVALMETDITESIDMYDLYVRSAQIDSNVFVHEHQQPELISKRLNASGLVKCPTATLGTILNKHHIKKID